MSIDRSVSQRGLKSYSKGQRAEAGIIEHLVREKDISNKIILFDSENIADKESDLNGKNGVFRSSDGTIWVDINAQQGLLGALSHELTHMVELLDNKTYKQIAEILIDKYSEKASVDSELRDYEKRLGLTVREAYSEFVADCMTQMLTDTNAAETIIKLRNVMNEKTQNRFIKTINDAIKTVKSFLRDKKSNIETANITSQLDCLQNIADLWAKGVANSMNEFDKAVKSENTDSKKAHDIEADNGQVYNSKKYAKPLFPHNNFPDVRTSRGSNAHEEAIQWANNSRVNNGDWKLASYNDNWYIIEKFDDMDLKYQVTEKISKNKYNYYALRWEKQYGQKIEDSVARSEYEFDNIYRRECRTTERTANFNDDVLEYGRKSSSVQRMGESEDGERQNQLDTGSSSLSGNEDRQGDETSGLNEKSNNDNKFSLKAPVEETKELLAIHNIFEKNLIKSLKNGGFPMPSIAIVKAKTGHNEFGEISVVFNKSTIDPKITKENKVYGGDAWTPVYPSVEYKLNEEKASTIYRKAYELSGAKEYPLKLKSVYFHPDNLENQINSLGGEEKLVDDYKNDYGMKQMYLAETGNQITEYVTQETRSKLSNEEIDLFDYVLKNFDKLPNGEGEAYKRMWLKENSQAFDEVRRDYYRQLIKGISEEKIDNIFTNLNETGFAKYRLAEKILKYKTDGAVTVKTENDIEATKKQIDEQINQAEYEKWLKNLFNGIVEKSGIRNNAEPYTPSGNRRSFEELHYEETLENVVKQMKSQRNGDVSLFAGLGIWGVAAKNYGTLDEIKSDSTRLQNLSQEEYSKIKISFGDRFTEIANTLENKYKSDNPFIDIDNRMTNILDSLRIAKTRTGLKRELNKWLKNVSDSTVSDLLDLIADIGNMPVSYFEAKPQRAVGINEIKTVVIPQDSSNELVELLEINGIDTLTYDGTDEDRTDKLNSLDDLKFSTKTNTNEFRTNAMIWANSADTKVGDTKILCGGGKGFALLEATDNGYIELARGNYDVVKGAKDYYERTDRAGKILDRYAESLENERRRNDWDFGDFENIADERRAVGLDSIESNNDQARIDEQSGRDSEKFSVKTIPNNRQLLSQALETVAQNDVERKYIADYKSAIGMLEKQQEKLAEINQEIGELSFAPGQRNTARLKELQEERTKTLNRINIYDKKLLRLEATNLFQMLNRQLDIFSFRF